MPVPSAVRSASPSLLVLGAGYVGGEVVRGALARGWRVSALTRNAEKAAALRAAGCANVIEADLASDAWHAAAGTSCDFVLNSVSSSGGGVAGYRHSYLAGMASVGRWLTTQPKGGTIVYTSSTGVYPQGGGVAVDERTPTAGASETGQVLVEAEQALAAAANASGWRWFVLRLAGIYGPGRHGVLDQLRAGASRLGGDPAHRMNLIHRDDAAAASESCFASAPGVRDEVFNVCDGAAATRAEFAAWLAQQLGVPVPEFDATAAPRGGNPVSGRAPAPDRVIVADKIRRVLGWSPLFADYRAGYAPLVKR